MSWSPPKCPECPSTTTRFERAVAFGPPDAFGLYWQCERCNARVLELCPTGAAEPRPGACLNCGADVEPDGYCSDCYIERAPMVARVHARCGSPPRLNKIAVLADEGLLRLAFNAVDLRLEQLPDDPATLVAKAKLMSAVNRPARAVPLLRRALELGAEPRTAITLGVALAESERHEEALGIYADHLEHETDPQLRAVVLSNMGGCLSALGHEREAEAYHRRAIEADPEHLGPRWNLFANLFRRRHFHGALEVVEQTIALPFLEGHERENLQAYRAEVLIGLERYDDALAAIDLSLVHDADSVARLGCRARILLELEAYEAARACVAKILTLEPRDPIARFVAKRLDARTGTGRN